MKKIKRFLIIMILSFMPMVVTAQPGLPGEKKEITYVGFKTITEDITESDQTYTSKIGSENVILVSGGNSKLENSIIMKSGEATGEDADFYGTNAAILVYNGAVLDIINGEINTDGAYGNAVFAYDTGIINISGTIINTTSNNSGGLMVTGGGTLNVTSCTVTTTGNSSAAIRSDRGGGTLTVNGGTYETSGQGSPVVYSTASIIINNATLISNSSEGLVIEGANSITLNNTHLNDTNNTLHGNSETYKNIFLYQSMSGDAKEGESLFDSKNSSIVTNKGDTIFVTNTKATINLENNEIINNDGDFLRIQKSKWGNDNENGGHVLLNLNNQQVKGDIIVDDISDLSINMTNKSILIGAINKEQGSDNISLSLSSDSILSLTSDTYINSLENELEDNSNIYSNGKYKLYVNGEEININNNNYEPSELDLELTDTVEEEKNNSTNNVDNTKKFIVGGVGIILLGFTTIIIKRRNRKM